VSQLRGKEMSILMQSYVSGVWFHPSQLSRRQPGVLEVFRQIHHAVSELEYNVLLLARLCNRLSGVYIGRSLETQSVDGDVSIASEMPA